MYGTSIVPTANIAVNKGRVKLYEKLGELPTYYLQKGQEFQIELFNPTTDNVLAKIYLNNKPISQGGLVLRPGQRVFLERFLENNSKFLFDTYEVSGSDEVKAAIKNNGDFRVEFFREKQNNNNLLSYQPQIFSGSFGGPVYGHGITLGDTTGGYVMNSLTTTNVGTTSSYYSNSSTLSLDNNTTFTSASFSDSDMKSPRFRCDTPKPKLTKSLSVETGRVEEGSKSNQKLTTVDKKFEYSTFHKVACKLIPISQKINTTEDLNVKKYCTNCGAKINKGDKFCSQCGTKA